MNKIDVIISNSETFLLEKNTYYPFGLQHATSWTRETSLKNNRLFNAGSELNELTKNYETFYRNYDPAIGRFNSVDIKATKFHDTSPYAFANNDPIYFNDPLGDQYMPYLPPGYQTRDGRTETTFGGHGGGSGGGSGSGAPGSGFHWSDQYRSVEGNLAMMSTSGFRNFYGIDNMSDSQLANFAVGSGLGSSDASDIAAVTGWTFNDRVAYLDANNKDAGTTRFIALTNGDGQWIGNLSADYYQTMGSTAGFAFNLSDYQFQRNTHDSRVGTGFEVAGSFVGAFETGTAIGLHQTTKGGTAVKLAQKGAYLGGKTLGRTLGGIGLGLTAANIAYEIHTNNINTHSFVDGGIALATFAAGAIALTVGAPVIAVGAAVVGIGYGIFSIAGGEQWIDNASGDWGSKLIYGGK